MGKLFDEEHVITITFRCYYLKACLYSSLTGGACYKVMMESGNYDLVHEFFGRMTRSGEVPKALTYKGSF